jgi:hypothetical protein
VDSSHKVRKPLYEGAVNIITAALSQVWFMLYNKKKSHYLFVYIATNNMKKDIKI